VTDPMRLNPYTSSPKAYRSLVAASRDLAAGTVESSLRTLVEIRVSQINGCGFCLAMHTDQARAAGVPQSKLDTLAGWREDGSFSAQERAALALAEAVTVLDGPVDQDLWDHATEQFSEAELSDLLYLIGLINLYNRLNIAVEFPAELWREKGIAGLRPSRE
jgi:AhpD family alkylhydroperoxidase